MGCLYRSFRGEAKLEVRVDGEVLHWRYFEKFYRVDTQAYLRARLIRRVIDEVIVTTTYGAILQKVAEVALASAEIKFNKRVISIEGAEDGRDANLPVLLRTDDGSSQSFDEVVLTTPLGWLKRNKTAFSPGLPPRLSEAIDKVSVGYLEKVGKTIIYLLGKRNPSGRVSFLR